MRATAGHDLNYLGDAGLLGLSLGNPEHPTVPPVLAADLAGGSYPAVVNILLAVILLLTIVEYRLLNRRAEAVSG